MIDGYTFWQTLFNLPTTEDPERSIKDEIAMDVPFREIDGGD